MGQRWCFRLTCFDDATARLKFEASLEDALAARVFFGDGETAQAALQALRRSPGLNMDLLKEAMGQTPGLVTETEPDGMH